MERGGAVTRIGTAAPEYARAAEHHYGRTDAPGVQSFFDFGELEQKADAAHRVALNEIGVKRRQPIGA
jgi:hypothetical protein